MLINPPNPKAMKKQLLSFGFALVSIGLMAALPFPFSATNTDTNVAITSIRHTYLAPTLDGIISDDEVWNAIDPVPIDRPFNTSTYYGSFTPDTPTLYEAYWKACWTDTAVFVLVYAEDNNFWPSWKSYMADWQSDKVEVYMGVNGIEPGEGGPANSGAQDGLYQITHNYDQFNMGTPQESPIVPGAYEANTYTWGDHAILITEWSVHIGYTAGKHTLWQKDSTIWDPTVDSVIKFDVGVVDLDSGSALFRQRQMWSNVGRQGENWVNMDFAGHLTLSSNNVGPVMPVDAYIKKLPSGIRPSIDGKADNFWSSVSANNIAKDFYGETPTLYSSTWKAVWNDTAMFVLVQVSDDDFWPSWKSKIIDPPADKVELYFDVNGTKPDGLGPDKGDGNYKGHYQVTHDYTETNPGSVNICANAGYEADTWSWGDHCSLTTEWCVSFKMLHDSNGLQLNPHVRPLIDFDVYVLDADSGQVGVQRKVWHNTGENGENWVNMDSAGTIKFLKDTVPVVSPPAILKSTINKLPNGCSIKIDGEIDNIWKSVGSNNIVRSFLGEHPSITSAYWKAVWNDTAIFVLVNVQDNDFIPPTFSGPHCGADGLALFFNVNSNLADGNGPLSSGNLKDGHYEISPPFIKDGNKFLRGSNGIYYAYDSDTITARYLYEYSIALSALKDKDGNALNPASRNTIGFDVEIYDADLSTCVNRLLWSNSGANGDNTTDMDLAGNITLSSDVVSGTCINAVPAQKTDDLKQVVLYPNPASGILNFTGDIDRIAIYSVLGQLIKNIDVHSNVIDISYLPHGLYLFNSFKNNLKVGSQIIIRQ